MDDPAQARADGAFEVTNRLVLSIAIPMTLGFLTTPLLGLTDTAVVGRTGSATALAGLAIGAVLFDLLFTSLNFLRASTTALVAQAFGRGNLDEQQTVFWRSTALSFAFGLLILVLSPLLLSAGLWLMGTTGEVAEATSTYFSIRILAGPLTLANFTILGFVLGRGQGKTGLLLQALLNGTNIVLSIYLGLVLDWGIAGVAWGTLIGEAVAAATGFLLVFRQFRGRPHPTLAELLDAAKLKALFAINRDILIRTMVLLGAFTLMTRIGTTFGPVTLAANAVLMNFFLLSGYFLDGFAAAAEQLAGRAIGARYRHAFDRAVRLTAVWGFSVAGGVTLFFLWRGDLLIDLMTTSPEVRELALAYLPWAAFTSVTGVLAFQMDGVFMGATWSSDLRNMMVASFAVFIAALWLLIPAFGNVGLWSALHIFLLTRGFSLLSRLPARARTTFA